MSERSLAFNNKKKIHPNFHPVRVDLSCYVISLTSRLMICEPNLGTHIEALYVFIGENLSEERFFPEPLSKDF